MAYQRFIYHGNIAGLLSALCHLTVSGLSDAAHGAATASNTVGKSNLSTCIAIVAELVLATCFQAQRGLHDAREAEQGKAPAAGHLQGGQQSAATFASHAGSESIDHLAAAHKFLHHHRGGGATVR